MFVIIDYGMGNLLSVKKAFSRIGSNALVSDKPKDILNADKLVLPGVGHFKSGIQHLKERNLIAPMEFKVLEEKTPILGICLGMQLMTTFSEEGGVAGLGWFDAKTVKFKLPQGKDNLRIPHMGWNTIEMSTAISIFHGIRTDAPFYFVHSYHVHCNHAPDAVATTTYGIRFTSCIHRDNLFGVQFHPEKSYDDGLLLLKNFSNAPRLALSQS